MKKIAVVALALAILPCGIVACNNTSGTGGSGGDNSFKISGPSGTTDIQQGAAKNEKVSIARGKDFKQSLTFDTQDVPKGVKVTFDPTTVKASDKAETMMTIKAADDATLGEATFKIIAKPETGASEPLGVKIKVTKK